MISRLLSRIIPGKFWINPHMTMLSSIPWKQQESTTQTELDITVFIGAFKFLFNFTLIDTYFVNFFLNSHYFRAVWNFCVYFLSRKVLVHNHFFLMPVRTRTSISVTCFMSRSLVRNVSQPAEMAVATWKASANVNL